MHFSAASPGQRLPILLSLATILVLALLPRSLHATAAPALPRILESSPFANRIQAEANAVQLACSLMLPLAASARLAAAVVSTDISGTLEFSLRQFCSLNSRDSYGVDVQIRSFGSRSALRTALMLRRFNPQLRAPARASPSGELTRARVRGCGQALSDLDELSFASSSLNCSVEQASVELPYRSTLDTPQPLPAAPSAFFSLTLALDLGRATSHRIHAISTLLAADSSAPARASVRIVELQWDMQTGNFIEGSLDIITAATTPVPGGPQCLSALITSGYRCLQTPCKFTPLLFLLHTCNAFAIAAISSSAPSLPIISLHANSFISAPVPFATLEEAHASLLHLSEHACPAFFPALSFVHIFKLTPQMQPPRSVLATHAFRAGSADRPQSISLDFVTAAQQQVYAFVSRQSAGGACADAVVFNFENPSLHGHGAQAHTILSAAKLAHLMQRVLLINTSAPWAFNSGSVSVWGGLLQNLSSCTPSFFVNVSDDPERVRPGQTLVLRPGAGSSALSRHDLRSHDLGAGARSPLHLALLHGLLLARLISPSQPLQNKVDSFMRAHALLPGAFVAAHLRRGHKFVEADTPSLSEYADAIAAVAAAVQVSVALVITEDAASAAELPTLLKRLGIRAELYACKRHALRISIPLAIQLQLLDADTENSQSLINLLAAAQSAAVVGTFSSGYSRLIFEMACANSGRIVPHRSLDLRYFV